MTLSGLAAEIARPVTDRAMLFGIFGFFLLFELILAAGLLGLWLLIVVAPAFSRFLLAIAQARIDRKPLDPPAIESFNPVDSLWSYLPLVQIALAIVAVRWVHAAAGSGAAMAVTAAFLLLLPASFGLLALTHSPGEALNPRSLLRLVRECGRDYLAIPLLAAATSLSALLVVRAGADAWISVLLLVALPALVFSLTGRIVAEAGLADRVDGPEAMEPERARVESLLIADRSAVLNHAYGLFSRGNRAGGLDHIEDFIGGFTTYEARIDEYSWFFARMLDWEEHGPGLLLGQRYLSELRRAGATAPILKVLSRCYLEADGFAPLEADRSGLIETARAAGREDLLERLERRN